MNRAPARKKCQAAITEHHHHQNEMRKHWQNIAEAACKHISYKSVGHRTACLADIWKSYTDRRLENASGTKRLALSRETFFLRIVDFHTLPGGNSQILQCILHFTRPTSPRTQPSLLLSDGLFSFFLHLFTSPSPPFLTLPISFGFRFGIPRVLGNSFLGRLKESGLQGHHQ